MNANIRKDPILSINHWVIKWKQENNKVTCKVKNIMEQTKAKDKARCNKGDQFDMVFGMKISLSRALKKMDICKDERQTIMRIFGDTYGWGKCEKLRIQDIVHEKLNKSKRFDIELGVDCQEEWINIRIPSTRLPYIENNIICRF